jgi:hypothetical protein
VSERDSIQPGPKWHFLLFIPGLFFLTLSIYPLAAVFHVLLAARHWSLGERRKAWGIVAMCAVLAALLVSSIGAGVAYGLSVSLGCLTGVLAERRWSFGWRLTALTGVAFAGISLVFLAMWQTFRHLYTIGSNAMVAEMAKSESANEQALELLRWSDLNYTYVLPGFGFGMVLVASATVLNVADRWPQHLAEAPTRRATGFQRMRLPDWLVWVAIAAALLWFAERQWPNEMLRVVTWNSAIALAWIYGLNGFSILLYALTAMKATALASVVVVSGVLMFLMHFLGLVGLFDTWYDFRHRFRRLAMLRRVVHWSRDREL